MMEITDLIKNAFEVRRVNARMMVIVIESEVITILLVCAP